MHIVLTVNVAWNILNFRTPLVRALIADGHRVTILAPFDDTIDELRDLGCECVDLPMDRKGLNPIGGVVLYRRMLRAFRELAPDVVFGFTIKNNIFGAMAARRLGLPFIPNVTGLGTAFLGSGLLLAVTKTLYRSAFTGLKEVFFQNADDRDLFVQNGLVRPWQATLLPGSGIDLDSYPALPYLAPDPPMVFLMIARLLRDKGVREYAEAARQLARAGLVCRLVGAIDEHNRTAISKTELEGWQQSGAIDYVGPVSDVRPYIENAHCVVLPSYREGAPRTLIEAAACARPLIATDVPGCRDVVEDGRNGFLCEVRSANALASAMERFCDLDHIAKTEMAAASRKLAAERYDVRHVIEAYRAAIARQGRNKGNLCRVQGKHQHGGAGKAGSKS